MLTTSLNYSDDHIIETHKRRCAFKINFEINYYNDSVLFHVLVNCKLFTPNWAKNNMKINSYIRMSHFYT